MTADTSQRFLFEHQDIRGELVQLDQSYVELLNTHHYPEPVANLLGEFLAAIVLLSSSLKFNGTVSLQAQSRGLIPLIMVQCTTELQVRGLAQVADGAASDEFAKLLEEGTLSLSIEPADGNRYQGIVPLDGAGLGECLQHYFQRSEQLATIFVLASDRRNAAGLMLQQLPAQLTEDGTERQDQWHTATQLAQTISADELLHLATETLLYRLYHTEELRLFQPRAVQYRCTCSKQRSARALLLAGRVDMEQLLAEHGLIEMNCELCNQIYRFDQADLEEIFSDGGPGEPATTSSDRGDSTKH